MEWLFYIGWLAAGIFFGLYFFERRSHMKTRRQLIDQFKMGWNECAKAIKRHEENPAALRAAADEAVVVTAEIERELERDD